MMQRDSIHQRSGFLATLACAGCAVLALAGCSEEIPVEDRSCDDRLFEPMTVSMSEVSGVEALEMVVRTAGMELELNTEVQGNVELAEEYKLGLDILDEIAAQLDLEWTQYGCRIIVAGPGELQVP